MPNVRIFLAWCIEVGGAITRVLESQEEANKAGQLLGVEVPQLPVYNPGVTDNPEVPEPPDAVLDAEERAEKAQPQFLPGIFKPKRTYKGRKNYGAQELTLKALRSLNDWAFGSAIHAKVNYDNKPYRIELRAVQNALASLKKLGLAESTPASKDLKKKRGANCEHLWRAIKKKEVEP